MKKYILMTIISAIPFQAFCYQALICNGLSVENQIVSLEQWGGKVEAKTSPCAQNPSVAASPTMAPPPSFQSTYGGH